MPRQNYKFEKRQKELAKKQKKEDKRQRKQDKKPLPDETAEQGPVDAEAPAPE